MPIKGADGFLRLGVLGRIAYQATLPQTPGPRLVCSQAQALERGRCWQWFARNGGGPVWGDPQPRQMLASLARYARSTARFTVMLIALPTRVTSMRPAVSSSFR